MKKFVMVFLTTFMLNFTLYAQSNKQDMIADIINPPDSAALSIILETLSSLKALQEHKKYTFDNIVTLIELKLVPHLDMDVAAEYALRKHWETITDEQKTVFKKYLLQVLINDYASIIANSNDNLSNVEITADKEIKRKDNKALVKLNVKLNATADPIVVAVRMVQTDKWKIYDFVITGVSLMKNYRANFNNQIKRKGIDSLVEKLRKKIK